jgi:zinc-binding alcohol dehydrogenase/oxidoreductase
VVFCRDFEIFGEHRSGTLAEKVLLFQRNLVRKPTAMSWEVAGCYGLVTGTAYRMLMKARLQSAEKVLVVGVGGGVSSTAMLMAKATGAKVWVTSRSPHKIDWALANGAEAGFDSSEPFSKAVKAATDGGADLVVDNVGPATWEQSVRSLAMGGRVVVVGGTSGQKVELSLPVVFFKHIEVIGSTMFNHGEFARATNMVATGAVPVPIDRVFPFEELPEALTRLEQGDQLGKIGVRVSS